MTILFSCKACGLVKEKAFIRYRRENEDILDWMKEVGIAIAMYHDLASQGIKTPSCTIPCRPKTIDEVFIPTPANGRGIGLKE